MAVTPNYSWPVPVNTDYVKDGAEAIKDLGDAIDSTVFGLGSGALSLVVAETAFTTQSEVDVNNCFTSTYTNYKVIFRVTATSAGVTTEFRFRVGGVNSTTGHYSTNVANYSSNTALNDITATVNGSSQQIGTPTSVNQIEIFNPQLAAISFYTGNGTRLATSPLRSETTGGVKMNGLHNVAQAYDGISFSVPSGTMTGTYAIYGYGKA